MRATAEESVLMKAASPAAGMALRAARMWGRHCPLPWRRWRICMNILRAAGVHPWQHPAAWRKLAEGLPGEVVRPRGLELLCDWRDSTYLGLLLLGEHEPRLSDLLETVIRPGDAVLDAGANIGYVCLLAAKAAGAKGRVWAYEPVARTFAKLEENLHRNARRHLAEVVARPRGLSDEDGEATIYLRAAAGADGEIDSGHSSIVPGFAGEEGRTARETIRLVRLDDEPIDRPLDVVKCDVEGAELKFLRGGRERLARDLPLMLLESNAGAETYTPGQLAEEIRRLGPYEFFSVGRGRPKPIRPDELARGGNVLCAIRDRHAGRLFELL
jgi:FkbM family methyltransferase